MLAITAAQLRTAALSRVNEKNMQSVLVSCEQFAEALGMNKPHILAQFFAQIMHESGDFRYDGEIWGPTEAQKRYDTRADLGNTPVVDGDGYLYRGRTAMQLTGKSNYRQFRDWCRSQAYEPPDFVASPDLVNSDPWEGLVPLWYWTTRNLNRWANEGDVETITKKINGGKNGLQDRINRLARVSLVLLGYKADNIRQFQADKRLEVDGDAGPKTRSAMHQALVAMVPGESAKPEVKAAPVTEEKTVAVTPPSLDKPWYQSKEVVVPILTGGGLTTAGSFLEKFGSIPVENLAILVGAAVVIMAGVLLYLRSRDQTKVAKAVAQVEG